MKNYDELKWYVLIHDFNTDEIRTYNIFNNTKVHTWIDRALKYYIDFNLFKEELKGIFRYAFGSKVEYEIIMKGMIKSSKEYKIDVYCQLESNIDLIARYIIDTYNKRKRKKLGSE